MCPLLSQRNRWTFSLYSATSDTVVLKGGVKEKKMPLNSSWGHEKSRFLNFSLLQVPEYLYPKDSIPDYLGILVPNVDNVRMEFLIETIARQSKSVLLIGEQGSAKTVIVQGYCGKYDPEVHMFKSFNFSSASTPFMFQVGR